MGSLRVVGLVVASSALVAALATPANADEEAAATTPRADRRYLIGFSPAWPWIAGADATVPLPAVRLGLQTAPRASAELTAGGIPMGDGGSLWHVDLGGRWFATTGAFAPYVLARAGLSADRGNEGGDRTYPFAAIGGGLDYTRAGGFTAWVELGPTVVSYTSGSERELRGGVYACAGVGYRVR